MTEEVFRKTLDVRHAERLLIDEVWADVLRRNRWQRRAWRLINRIRALSVTRVWSRFAR